MVRRFNFNNSLLNLILLIQNDINKICCCIYIYVVSCSSPVFLSELNLNGRGGDIHLILPEIVLPPNLLIERLLASILFMPTISLFPFNMLGKFHFYIFLHIPEHIIIVYYG